MALQKEIPTQSGVTGNYLRILKINSVDVRKKTADITVGLFLNKQASDDGKTPLQSKSFQVALNNVDGNIRQQAYPLLKIQADEKEQKNPMLKGKGKFNNISLNDSIDV